MKSQPKASEDVEHDSPRFTKITIMTASHNNVNHQGAMHRSKLTGLKIATFSLYSSLGRPLVRAVSFMYLEHLFAVLLQPVPPPMEP